MLTVTVVALLMIRLALQPPATSPLVVLAVAGTLAGWLALLVISGRRITAMAAAEPVPVGQAIPLTALTTVGLAGLGLLLVAAP